MAGKITVSTINDSSGVLATQNGMTGIAKAWVQVQTSGSTPTINGSFNVSSITRSGTGLYAVSFTTAMANINYSALSSASINQAAAYAAYPAIFANASSPYYSAPTTSGFNLQYNTGPGTSTDPVYFCVAVFGA